MFFLLLLVMIIGFPRFFADGSIRINTIFVFWLSLSTYYFFICKPINTNLIKVIIPVFIAFVVISFYLRIEDDLKIRRNQQETIFELKNLINTNSKYLIVTSEFPELVKYQLYYINSHEFGYVKNIEDLPFSTSISFNYYDPKRFRLPVIRVERINKTLRIKSYDNLVYLNIDKKNVYCNTLLNMKVLPHKSGRGFSDIQFEIPDTFMNYRFIYFNGKNWKFV
ncbi:MAG: hypothetical protein NTX22_17310 [Ignavibacteriales bacterium]|nr:hypothetical protein [Ignavibacteriales bacterium]